MRQFFAGAALTALLTVAVGGIVAGKVYVPVGASNSGLADAAPARFLGLRAGSAGNRRWRAVFKPIG